MKLPKFDLPLIEPLSPEVRHGDAVYKRPDGNYLIVNMERGGRHLKPHYYILSESQFLDVSIRNKPTRHVSTGWGFRHTTKKYEALTLDPN